MNSATDRAHLPFPSEQTPEPLHNAGEDLPGPLAGIRVLDLTRVLSGPHAARMLCDMGADVIKIEPPDGDLTRFSNPRVGGMASYFIQQNAGKRNVSINMADPRGVELVLAMIAESDVVIENFRPGVMDRIGLGYEVARGINPRLVYASISGYGSTGPWRHRRAYATVVAADTGFTKAQCDAHSTGHHPDGSGEPTPPPTYVNDPHSHGDVYTGMEATSAILAALYQRERTGRGQQIEVSMAQTLLYVNEHTHDHLWDGDVSPEWIRSFRPGDYPALTVGNGETVLISGHPAERGTFDRFVTAMRRPELLDDPRFATVSSRLANFDGLVAEMRAWALEQPDPAAVDASLDSEGLVVGVLRSVREIAESEWAIERNAIVSVPDRNGGVVRVPNSPWTFSDATTGVSGEPRYRGEDNAEVLRNLLRMDEAAILLLTEEGVLTSRTPRPETPTATS